MGRVQSFLGVSRVSCVWGQEAQQRQGWGSGEAGYCLQPSSCPCSRRRVSIVCVSLTGYRRLHALCAHTIDSCLSRCGPYPALVHRQRAVCIFACWRLCDARLCNLLLCSASVHDSSRLPAAGLERQPYPLCCLVLECSCAHCPAGNV
jgi:hypothetical protein